jgi:hypothetical protein
MNNSNNSHRRRGAPSKQQRRRAKAPARDSRFTSSTVQTVTLNSPIVAPVTNIPMTSIDSRSLIGGQSIAERWNPNATYQPLVGGPTATIPGFSTWATFYGFYRVISYSYDITFSNLEAFPVNVWTLNQNNDPGTTPFVSSAANGFSQRNLLSSKGGQDKCRIRGTYKVSQILGSNAPSTDSAYRSLINTTPADVLWLAICAQSSNGASLTNGVTYTMSLTMNTQFFDRLTL